ncbi:hypothetical protein V2G26_000686 [Clonostachys chloroleuca]
MIQVNKVVVRETCCLDHRHPHNLKRDYDDILLRVIGPAKVFDTQEAIIKVAVENSVKADRGVGDGGDGDVGDNDTGGDDVGWISPNPDSVERETEVKYERCLLFFKRNIPP